LMMESTSSSESSVTSSTTLYHIPEHDIVHSV
jgi:hypothetical protein